MATLDELNARSKGNLPELLGVTMIESAPGRLVSRMAVTPVHLAGNGFLHAASVIALADTTCGYGSLENLPPGGANFTTIEVKCNFLGTARSGAIRCDAEMAHGGRTTQVWDARVTDETTGKAIALFRCTQLIMYPRP